MKNAGDRINSDQQILQTRNTYLVQLFHRQRAQNLALVAFEGAEQRLVDVLGALRNAQSKR